MNVKGYTLIKTEELNDIHSTGYYLRHDKTGARIACVKNSDENKVFYIGFRTPSRNSTGNAHILEHSVLCGSAKYPVKDPFVELAKGSLNTFLNAMTYPDKTVYPVASCNDKDFENLVDVYLDAVFHPAIYDHPEIFQQEGWHYEMESVDDDITLNGVVYNEMKGAFSTAEDVLSRINLNSLYPDTSYGFESGGDPDNIPELSYEQFLDFHKTLYHPSNSYIYFYGDMDFEEKLRKLDEDYLSKYDDLKVDSELTLQQPFADRHLVKNTYAISADEDEKDNTFLALNFSYGDSSDMMQNAAVAIIDEVLLSSPAAPIRLNLIKAGICQDVMGGYDDGIYQQMFSIIAKNSNEDQADKFLEIIFDTIREEIKKGFNKELIEGILTNNIFTAREADTGRYPKGLLYGLGMMDTWLYYENEPFATLYPITVFEKLLELNGTGYFEKLAEEVFLENTHSSFVILTPERDKAAKDDAKLAKKLADYKATLSKDELAAIVDATKHLKDYQAEKDSQEALMSLPLLERDDIRKNVKKQFNESMMCGGAELVYHDYDTNGIAYHDYYFEVTDLSEKEWKTLGVLNMCLGLMNTKKHSYGELYAQKNLRAGGMGFHINPVTCLYMESGARHFMMAQFKSLYEKTEAAAELNFEIILETLFEDRDRLRELIMEKCSGMEMAQAAAGHVTAMSRAFAGVSERAAIREISEGYEFYKYLKGIEADFDNCVDEVLAEVKALAQKIFVRKRVMVSVTCEKSELEHQKKIVAQCMSILPEGKAPGAPFRPVLTVKREGLYDASKVVYVARCGNYLNEGLEHNGALSVLKCILSYDYLWINVRVQGGAYGCMTGFSMSGNSHLVSYRDPHLEETNDIFEKCADYVENFDASERDMTKYVIGAFGEIDPPHSAHVDAAAAMECYIGRVDEATRQKHRDQARLATPEDIRKLAPYVRAIISSGSMTVYGNEEKIKASKLLDSVEAVRA